MKKFLILFLAVLLIPLASALTQVSSCQTLNSAGETYNLTNNVSVSGTNCFTISADNVTFNGNNFTVKQDSPGNGIAFNINGLKNVTLSNFNVISFDTVFGDYNSGNQYITNSSFSNFNVFYSQTFLNNYQENYFYNYNILGSDFLSYYSVNNNFTNLYFDSTSSSLYIDFALGSNNNYFNNLTILSGGMHIEGSSYNVFDVVHINNSLGVILGTILTDGQGNNFTNLFSYNNTVGFSNADAGNTTLKDSIVLNNINYDMRCEPTYCTLINVTYLTVYSNLTPGSGGSSDDTIQVQASNPTYVEAPIQVCGQAGADVYWTAQTGGNRAGSERFWTYSNNLIKKNIFITNKGKTDITLNIKCVGNSSACNNVQLNQTSFTIKNDGKENQIDYNLIIGNLSESFLGVGNSDSLYYSLLIQDNQGSNGCFKSLFYQVDIDKFFGVIFRAGDSFINAIGSIMIFIFVFILLKQIFGTSSKNIRGALGWAIRNLIPFIVAIGGVWVFLNLR